MSSVGLKRSRLVALAASAGLLLLEAPVSAQSWLADRSAPQGNGIRVGNFELHPGLGVEAGYDSDTFTLQPMAAAPAFRMRFTGSFGIQTLGAQRSQTPGSSTASLPTVVFQASVGLIGNLYVATTQPDTVSRLSNLGVMGNLNVHLFPGRTWQFRFTDTITRMVQGTADGAAAILTSAFNAVNNDAVIEGTFAPNSGTLEFKLAYQNRLVFFEDPQFGYFSSMSNTFSFRNSFRLWYRTQLFYGATASPNFFFDATRSATGLFFSVPMSGYLGFNGLITERLGLTVSGGVQATTFTRGDNTTTFIGQASLKYNFSESTSFNGGFIRDIQSAYLGNYYIRNRFNLAINQLIAQRFYFLIDAGFSINQNGYISDTTGARSPLYTTSDPTGRFIAFRVDAKAYGEYRFTNYFALNLTGTIATNQTDTVLRVGTTFQPLLWTKAEIFLGARLSW